MNNSALVVKYAEIHLKGLNRPFFERKLVEKIEEALSDAKPRVVREQGRIFVYELPEEHLEEYAARLQKVFGIHSVSVAACGDKTWEEVRALGIRLMAAYRDEPKTFKVFAQVDVHHPEIPLTVEIRQDKAFLYTGEIPCAGGMPVGTNGKAMLLISGGIDSPVAGYMIAKRGVALSAIHFYSYPYTSERARDKVVELAQIVSAYAGDFDLYLVPFTEIQTTIYDKCPSSETTVLMRRLMMKIAERTARSCGALALVTGESIGQVASQTIESLAVTNDAVDMPVFRPLIGFDKEEIIERAKKIGTFETSILPYEDCCTVFVPQHPVTRPQVQKLRESEALVDFEPMIEEAIRNTEVIRISHNVSV